MSIEMGHTRVTCKKCRSVSIIDNRDISKIETHTCPNCGATMGKHELLQLQACYMALSARFLVDALENGGRFDFNIEFKPDL